MGTCKSDACVREAAGTMRVFARRLEALAEQTRAISDETYEISMACVADLGDGLGARLNPDGSLLINAGKTMPAGAVLRLRDFLCTMLGLPNGEPGAVTLYAHEAEALASCLVSPSVQAGTACIQESIARARIVDALDHVGAICREPRGSKDAGSALPLVRTGPGGDFTLDHFPSTDARA